MSLSNADRVGVSPASTHAPPDLAALREISHRVLWLATCIVDAANAGRPNESGVKVGGHQASSASMVDIMVALWFVGLTPQDRVSVKPHASPVLHAINYLLGDLDERHLTTLREGGGLQAYPSRSKDPDTVDFSTGSVGLGATAPLWAALAHRYAASHFASTPPAARFISLLGDAELDEGAVWEALNDPVVPDMGELLWVVDYNRQSLDRVLPDTQTPRLQAMFEAAGWEVLVLKWGRRIGELFTRSGGNDLQDRLETMPNEEYQRMLRAPIPTIRHRLLSSTQTWSATAELRQLLDEIGDDDLSIAVRDLGGHDLGLLVDAYAIASRTRPTVVLAYTIKGRRLPTEGHPNNHSALLTDAQMTELARQCGTVRDLPWERLAADTEASRLCEHRGLELRRQTPTVAPPVTFPTALSRTYRKPISTQAALGYLLADLVREAPTAGARVVTASPDVASSTNLGGWINKVGVWYVHDRHDWFADDTDRLLRWTEASDGRHIELGIAEVNLVSLLGELGATWSRWGERLIPIGTLYDPFVSRALEPWSYGIYAGGQSILVGTPSGVTLSSEGGAHQSITTPSIGLEQPGCVAWEPAFAQDLEWCMLAAMDRVGVPGGTSAYFRLSTRPLDPALASVPDDPTLLERRRRQATAGGYRLPAQHLAADEDVTLVGVGAIMPEVITSAATLAQAGVRAGVVCLTSPDLVFRSFQRRTLRNADAGSSIIDELFPREMPRPIVTVHDGHPHTLAFLAGARGDAIRCLGVSEFGQSSSVDAAYRLHGIDVDTIVDASLTILHR